MIYILPIERQAQIKELISQHKNLKISNLSTILKVSEMTIHRDLKSLLEEGFVIKTFGGISLAQSKDSSEVRPDHCVICMRPNNDKLAYRIILDSGKIEMTCCAHCGLIRHRQLGEQVIQAITHDFLKQTTVSAPLMHYIMDTTVDIGCCQPQVLTFEHRQHAEKFIKGFSGQIYTFQEAMQAVYERMNQHCCTQHQS